jgi:cytochrome c oxidase cbb3-type subunit 4
METLNDIVIRILNPLWVVLAMAIFTGIAVWAYWPRNKSRFQSYGDIPMHDDEPLEGRGPSSTGEGHKER